MSDGLIGKLVGRYVVEEFVEDGGFSTVYKARHETLEETVAIKVISLKMLNKEASDDFTKEQNLTMSLNHENIVKTIDFGTIEKTGTTQDGYPYIAMQFMKNGNLRNLVETKVEGRKQIHPLDEISTLNIALACLEGLIYTHNPKKGIKNGIVIHRDIHQGNILFDDKWIAHLGDFGLAKAKEITSVSSGGNKDHTLGFRGKYLPPEALNGNPDSLYDIFQFGCTLQYAITGEQELRLITKNAKGFYDEKKEMIIKQINACPNIYPIIAKAIESYKEDRWQSAQEMKDAVSSALEKSIYDLNENKYLHPFKEIDSTQGLLTPDQIYTLQEIVNSANSEKHSSGQIIAELTGLYTAREKRDSTNILEQSGQIVKSPTTNKKQQKEKNDLLDFFYHSAHAYARHSIDDLTCMNLVN